MRYTCHECYYYCVDYYGAMMIYVVIDYVVAITYTDAERQRYSRRYRKAACCAVERLLMLPPC